MKGPAPDVLAYYMGQGPAGTPEDKVKANERADWNQESSTETHKEAEDDRGVLVVSKDRESQRSTLTVGR